VSVARRMPRGAQQTALGVAGIDRQGFAAPTALPGPIVIAAIAQKHGAVGTEKAAETTAGPVCGSQDRQNLRN
jgi:hypothetical protein